MNTCGRCLKSVNQLHAMIRDLLGSDASGKMARLRVGNRDASRSAKLMQQAVTMMRPTAQGKQTSTRGR